MVGSKLTAVAPPVWVPSTGFTYSWYVDYQATGETGATYQIKPADLGKAIAVDLPRASGSASMTSSYFSLWSAPVDAGLSRRPTNVDLSEDRRNTARRQHPDAPHPAGGSRAPSTPIPVDARRRSDSRCDRS